MSEILSQALFEPRSGESWADPWPMYRALRDEDPVHRVRTADESGDYWVLTRHAHVYAAVRDHETFSSGDGLTTEYGELEKIGLAHNPPMVMTDPPVHTEFRKLVSRGFTPRQVESIEPTVTDFVVERLERLRADGGGDIVRDLFKPLPSMVVAHYLGVPPADWGLFDGWTDAIVAANAQSDVGGKEHKPQHRVCRRCRSARRRRVRGCCNRLQSGRGVYRRLPSSRRALDQRHIPCDGHRRPERLDPRQPA